MNYYIKNLINHDSILNNCCVTTDGEYISDICADTTMPAESYHYAVPGYIDIHTHGGDGYEMMDNSFTALETMSRFYLLNGTTSFLSSTVTDSLSNTNEVLKTVKRFLSHNQSFASKAKEAECLGVHLEGPWLSPMSLGAQNPEFCIVPESDSLEMIRLYSGIVKMVTFSYHTPESEALLSLLVEQGIIPATGHDEAIDERIIEGFANGIKVVTHIYCVTSSFRRVGGTKHLGTLEIGLMTDGIKVEVIADGKHVTKHIWDFIRHNKNDEDILIVSDSMRCAGLPEDPDKIHKLGDMDVIVDQGVAWTKDKKAFAGSIATMYTNFRRLVKDWGVDICDAVKMTSYNQAQLLGDDSLGELKPGKKADLLLLDEELNIKAIIKSGIFVNR